MQLSFLRNINTLLLGITSLLIFSLLTTGIYTLSQWRNDWELSHEAVILPASPAHPPTFSEIDQTLTQAHLFGNTAQLGNMPISNLQLRVIGISKTESLKNSNSKVIISIAGNIGKIFKIGDSLPYGVKIYDITENAIILENGGHLEKLPLSRPALEFKTPAPKET